MEKASGPQHSRRRPQAHLAARDPSGLDSCWLVVSGRRQGPMPFEQALECFHEKQLMGVSLRDLRIVHARQQAPPAASSRSG
jgi:hypothetical protein